MNKINELYEQVGGKLLSQERLYKGSFLEVLKEVYKLPNEKVVSKEKVVKNGGKDAVIVIAITENQEFIITIQNRLNNQKIAEFPSGYIEEGETPVEAAKRELMEETGYETENVFILDEAFTSPGIDNSTTYIVVANSCVKVSEVKTDSNELVTYGLFNEEELGFLISDHIMNGAMNKLAYYNFINNVKSVDIYCNSQEKTRKLIKKIEQ